MGLSDQDHALREGGIGASEISSILGMNPFHGPMDIWLRKTGRSERQPDTLQSELGHMQEQTAARMYARRMEHDTKGSVMVSSPTLVAKDQKIAVATPDRFVADNTFVQSQAGFASAVVEWNVIEGHFELGEHCPSDLLIEFLAQCELMVECKNVGANMLRHWAGEHVGEFECPDYVRMQCVWQMRVTGIEMCDIAAVLGGTNYQTFRVMRDQVMIDDISEFAEEWWQTHVVGDRPPPVDGTSAWKKYAAERWPDVKAAIMIPAEAGHSALAARHIEGKAAIKGWKAVLDEIETELKMAIEDNTGMDGTLAMEGRRWKATYKPDSKGSTDWKGLATRLAGSRGVSAKMKEEYTRDPPRKFVLRGLRS